MPKHFIKVKENFICDHCQTKITGTGYTNHCPACLYSKHVDKKTPGDRLSTCNSLMKPISLEIKSGKYNIYHQCLKCNKVIKNKTSPNNNQQKLIQLSKIPIKTKK